jgi:hypothetical protein
VGFEYLSALSDTTDKDAVLQDLMNDLGRDVWNYAYFLTGRFDVADDVFQDVFVKVYRNLFSFRGESSRTQGAQSLDQMIEAIQAKGQAALDKANAQLK